MKFLSAVLFAAASLWALPALGQVPTLLSVGSVQNQGGTLYSLPLTLTGTTSIECRKVSGSLQLVFTFNQAVTSGSASIINGTATINGNPTFSGSTMTVNLTSVTNAQYVTVSLSNLNGTGEAADIVLGVLMGDVNGDGVVNIADIGLVQLQSIKPISSTNYKDDINKDGILNAGDILLVRNASLTYIPPVTAPTPVANLTGTLSATNASEIDLTWTNPSPNNASALVLSRSPDGGTTWMTIGILASTANSYADTHLAPGSYEYQIGAQNAKGTAADSGSPVADPPLSAPTGLTENLNTSGTMTLSWTPVSGATSYTIDREIVSTGVWQSAFASSSSPTYPDIASSYGSGGYRYRISATANGSTSGFSAVVPTPNYAVIDLGANVVPAAFNNSGAVVYKQGTGYIYSSPTGTMPVGLTSVAGMNDAGTVVGSASGGVNLNGTYNGYNFNESYSYGSQWTQGGGVTQVGNTPNSQFILTPTSTIPLALGSGTVSSNNYYSGTMWSTTVGIDSNGNVYGNLGEKFDAGTPYPTSFIEIYLGDPLVYQIGARLSSSISPMPSAYPVMDYASGGGQGTGINPLQSGVSTIFKTVAGNGSILGTAEQNIYPPTMVPMVYVSGIPNYITDGTPLYINSTGTVVGTDNSSNPSGWCPPSYAGAVNLVNGISGPVNNKMQIVANNLLWQNMQLSSLNDLVAEGAGWNGIGAMNFNGAINDNGALVGTASLTTTAGTTTHGVMLLPVAWVRETPIGSGTFTPIKDNGLDDKAILPMFHPDLTTTLNNDVTWSGGYVFTAQLSANLSGTSTASMVVSFQNSTGTYSGTLTETSAGSGVFHDTGSTFTVTLSPTTKTTSNTVADKLQVLVTDSTLGLSNAPFTLGETGLATLNFAAEIVLAEVDLSGTLSTTAVNTIAVHLSGNEEARTVNASLTETGVNTRIFTRTQGDITITINSLSGTAMQISVQNNFLQAQTATLALTETSSTSNCFANVGATTTTFTALDPGSSGQGVFYIQMPSGSSSVPITLSSGANTVTVNATPVSGSPGLIRTPPLALLAPGTSGTYSGITTLQIDGTNSVCASIFGSKIDPKPNGGAFIGRALSVFEMPAPMGTSLTSLLTGAAARSHLNNIETNLINNLGWTVAKDQTVTYSDITSNVSKFSLFYILAHGATPSGDNSTAFAAFSVWPNYLDISLHPLAGSSVQPSTITANIGTANYKLVFINGCASADNTAPGGVPAAFAAAFKNASAQPDPSKIENTAYVGWTDEVAPADAVTYGEAFFTALKKDATTGVIPTVQDGVDKINTQIDAAPINGFSTPGGTVPHLASPAGTDQQIDLNQ